MMPSRGASLARHVVKQTSSQQRRQLSLAVSSRSSSPLHIRSGILSLSTRRVTQGSLVVSIASTRHASTGATPISVPPSNISAPPPDSANIDSVSLGGLDLSSVHSVTEHVGGLKELGIDYGWGPTSIIQFVLEQCHSTFGFEWWAAIAATAVVFRVISIPLYVKAADANARTAAMSPLTAPVYKQLKEAQIRRDTAGQQLAMSKLMQMRKDAGVSLSSQFAPAIYQMVVGFCSFRLMRRLAETPGTGLNEGGLLWLTDLTLPDPYLLLPFFMAASMHILIRMGGEAGTSQPLTGGMRNFMWYGMPGIILLVTGWQSGALCIWFAASGGLALGTSVTLQRPAIRNAFGIAPIYKPKKGEEGQSLATMWADMMKSDTKPKVAADSFEDGFGGGYTGSYNKNNRRPTYQAPTYAASKTIDTTATSSSSSTSTSSSATKGGRRRFSTMPSKSKTIEMARKGWPF